MPRILFITDDFSESSKQIILEENPDCEIVFWDKCAEHDTKPDFSTFEAIIIDYGVMGDDEYMYRQIYQSGAKIAWCGGLADRYYKDAQKHMPKLKFLQKIPSAPLSEVNWLIDHLFNKED